MAERLHSPAQKFGQISRFWRQTFFISGERNEFWEDESTETVQKTIELQISHD